MSKQKRRILVTSALPYANGAIHIGHMLEYIQTDIWARFQRAQGHECYFAWADDAHGTPIMLRAQAENITPEELIDRMNAEHQQDFRDFGLSFDNYSTTHGEANRECVEVSTNTSKRAAILNVAPSPSFTTSKKACSCPTVLSRAPAPSVKPRPVRRQL